MLSTLPSFARIPCQRSADRRDVTIARKDAYVLASRNGRTVSAYVSIRCDDTDSWMRPLVEFLARRPHTIEHEERITDPSMVGGAAWYRRYRLI